MNVDNINISKVDGRVLNCKNEGEIKRTKE